MVDPCLVILIVSNDYFPCHFHLDTFDSSLEVADDDQEGDGFWNLFVQLTTKLESLKLIHFFADYAVAEGCT